MAATKNLDINQAIQQTAPVRMTVAELERGKSKVRSVVYGGI